MTTDATPRQRPFGGLCNRRASRRDAAFTLAEFVVAIVFIGVVLGPLLVFVARVHDMNSAVGQQARRESWRSFTDAAVTAGIDPNLAPALGSAMNVAIPSVAPQAVTSTPVPAVAGLARIEPMRVVTDGSVAEARILAGGFQIGAGATVAARTAPVAPLTPIIMPMPVVTPTDGTIVGKDNLVAGAPGNPYTLAIEASASANATVRAVLNQPYGTFQGAGLAQFNVTAVDLLNGVNGIAWSEYPGDAAAGDRAVQLGDGRTRWLVTTSENRLQIYEPSPQIHFAYQFGLGAPVLVRAGTENTTGSTLTFDYAGYYAVQSGTVTLQIDFPQATKVVFGNAWAAQSIGFQWTFHDAAGAFSGDVKPFFQPDTLSDWADNVTIAAAAVVPKGAIADAATWTLTRLKSPLGVPVLGTAGDTAGFFTPGAVQFTAPNGPDGSPLGRLSFDNGASVSTGTTLSVDVMP